MDNIFSRTELLLGKEALKILAASRVAIFGIGGVGGYVTEALARSGIGEIDIIDSDKICPSNINRQIYATTSTIGKYKVDAAKESTDTVSKAETPVVEAPEVEIPVEELDPLDAALNALYSEF